MSRLVSTLVLREEVELSCGLLSKNGLRVGWQKLTNVRSLQPIDSDLLRHNIGRLRLLSFFLCRHITALFCLHRKTIPQNARCFVRSPLVTTYIIKGAHPLTNSKLFRQVHHEQRTGVSGSNLRLSNTIEGLDITESMDSNSAKSLGTLIDHLYHDDYIPWCGPVSPLRAVHPHRINWRNEH